MKHFIDREQEMETLQNEYARTGSALVILYGRRRVGKTTLISEFIKDKNALFFLASEESEVQNRNAFKTKSLSLQTVTCCGVQKSKAGMYFLNLLWIRLLIKNQLLFWMNFSIWARLIPPFHLSFNGFGRKF